MKNTLLTQFCKLTNSDTSLPKNTFTFRVLLGLFFKSNVNSKSKLNFKGFLAVFVLLLTVQTSWGQSYLSLDGGFEGTATIENSASATSAASGKWTKNNSTTTIADETSVVRSGGHSLKITNSSNTGRRVWSPLFTQSSTTGTTTIQFYRRSANNTTSWQESMQGVGNGTTTDASSGTYSAVTTINTWQKVSYTRASWTYTNIAAVIFTRLSGTGTLYIYADDVAVYAGSLDITAPNVATSAVVSAASSTSMSVGWTAASGGVDGGGYIVVRGTSDPSTAPNVNGIYAVGNTIASGMTVVYNGTGTSFTDTSLTAGTTYYYRIYTYDKAYNYADALTGNAATSSGSSPTLAITANTTAAFGSVCTNASPITKTYTITNTGTIASNVVVTSSNAEYVVGALSSTDVSATNGTVTFDVTYTPSSGSTGTTLTSKYDTSTTSGTLGLTGTAVAPITQVVSTSAATLVVNTTATLNGNYTTTGVCPATSQKGFVYAVKSTNADPLVSGTGVTQSTVTLGSTGNYLKALTGLTPATTYTYKAYVYNGTDYTYGTATDFTTLAVATKLVFSIAPPTTGTVGLNLTSFTVQAQRADNSVDAEYVASIVIGRTAISGSGALTGTTVSATAGVAVFAATQLDGAGTYTITASSGSLTGATAASNTVISLVATAMASWNFSASTMTGAAPTATANANVTVGTLTRGSGVSTTGTTYSRQWGGYNWAATTVAAAVTAGSFLSFTIKPNANYEVSFNNIPAYELYSNNTGPVNGQWQYSLNGTSFTSFANITFPLNGPNSLAAIDLSTITGLQNVPATTTVTFRLVAYGASSSTSGTFSFYDATTSTAADFIVNGYVSATSTTWTTSWSNGTPTTSLDAIINGNYNTTTNGVFSAKTLTVNATKTFTINPGHNITVAGAVINNGTFTVSNNANLIQTDVAATNIGNIIVNRDSASIQLYDYTLWSSPVAGQKLKAFSPNTLNTRFYTYNSGTNLYNVVTTPLTTDFEPATGYLIRAPNDHNTTPTVWNGAFTGVPNNGNQGLSSLTPNQYYATGNPYPSTIDADLFLGGNNTGGTLYFWRKTNNATATATTSYATYTLAGGVGTADNFNGGSSILPSRTIQVGQGFIVKTGAGVGATALNFTNAMRTANNDNQFLRTTNEKSRYWLNLTSSTGAFCQAMVAYMPEATSGVDNVIDGRYFNDSPVALTSIINAEEYTIQGRALPFATTDTVPLGFKTNATGNYTIAIDHVDGLFSTGQAVFLKDNLLNTVVDLSAGGYSFASAIGTFNSRFEVVYQNTLAVTNPTFTANSVIAFSANGEISINSGSTIMELVRVYDLQGRLLVEKKQINASETKLSTTATNQVLLVEITAANGSKITKKIIQ